MPRSQPDSRKAPAQKRASLKATLPSAPICVVVQGAFEKSDSIGFDAVFEYRSLKSIFGKNVFIFAERFDQDRYPDVPFRPISDFFSDNTLRNATVIYHYCDGWADFDAALGRHEGRAIVRWHNNTPPWFYAADSRRLAERCVQGFESIVEFAQNPRVEFWVNSDFTGVQLAALGADPSRVHTVYPASRYLSMPVDRRPDLGFGASGAIRLLFVSRVVAHKGHKHVVSLARYIQENLGRKVVVDFAGRPDTSANKFNDDLNAAIAASGVEVNLLGEVDESVLMDLYLTADVFVCCSEHEGFGLPAFEAMRCGLPTLTWARTAFAELLADLPTGIPNFDVPTFAGVVMSLEKDSFREAIVNLQVRIAETYTADFIASQMRHALAPADEPAPLWQLPLTKADQTKQAALRREIKQAAVAIKAQETHPAKFEPREEGHNVVTVYDILAYRGLLDGSEQSFERKVGRSTADRRFSSVLLPASDFFSIGGEPTPEGIVMPLGAEPQGHLVFGPYAPCPQGSYEAEFRFAPRSPAVDAELVIDVHSGDGGVLARRTIALSGETRGFKIDFQVQRDREILEFRAKLVAPGKGEALFQGVSVGKLNQISQLIERRDRRLVPDRPRWLQVLLTWMRPNFAEQSPPSPAGRLRFKIADKLRDGRNWAAAAKAYRDALEIDPGRVRYIIQMANCLKEAGNLPEAESAYLAALALTPGDADIWLQLSDVYDRMGDVDRTRTAWRQTLRASGPAVEALLRLSRSGNTAEEVESFIEGASR